MLTANKPSGSSLYRDYNDFFRSTYKLFKDITSYAIVLENIGGGKVEVTAINELRGVLFHLYNFSDANLEENEEYYIKNYYEAKDHLHRAYFDIFTMLHTFLSENIYNYSQKYELSIINTYYPKYFTHITPELTIISEHMSKIRAVREKKIQATEEQIISTKDIITLMLDWYRELQSMTSSFIDAQTKSDKEKEDKAVAAIRTRKKDRLDLILKIVIPIITLILGALINHLLKK